MRKYFELVTELCGLLSKGETVVVQSLHRHALASSVLALTQLFIDPYYATVDGFCCLIEKEFLFQA